MIDDFAEDSLFATVIDVFVAKLPQRRMVNKVINAIQARQSRLVEVETGTGKTFAFLVSALRSDKCND